MSFNPAGNEQLTLGGRAYRVRAFAPNGPLASKALRVVGGRAQVYQLIDAETELPYALKVMLPAFRVPQLVRNHDLLSQLGALPGFEACKQTYLTPQTHPDDLEIYPDLAYASLMPWIPGTTWAMIINDPDSNIDPNTSWEIAYQLVRLVRLLERQRIAHCDLSGSNVIVDLNTRKVTVIDFDDMYWPGAPPPSIEPTGTPGYRKWGQGQWTSTGDRFATAILVAEMLGWRDGGVRAQSSGDAYFTESDYYNHYNNQDYNHNTLRYDLLQQFLRQLHPGLGTLFERAWQARSNEECPSVDEWRTALIAGRGWQLVPLDPLDRARINTQALSSPNAQQQPPLDPTLSTPITTPGTHMFPALSVFPAAKSQSLRAYASRITHHASRANINAQSLLVALALLSGTLLLLGLVFLGASILLHR